MTLRQSATFLASALLLLGAAACGDSSTDVADDPTVSPSASPTETPVVPPNCSDIWVAGQTLPEEYEVCLDAAGAEAADELIECESGQNIFVHENRFYAAPGGKVIQAQDVFKDKQFKKVLAVCTG